MSLTLNKENMHGKLVNLYILCLAVPFLLRFPMLLGLSIAYTVMVVCRPLLAVGIAVAVTGLWMEREEKNVKIRLDAWLLIGAFCWMILVFLIHRNAMEEGEGVLLRAAISWIGFYPFGFLLNKEERKQGILFIAFSWFIPMVVLSAVGVACVATKTILAPFSGTPMFGMIFDGRLYLGIPATSTSENILTAALMGTTAMFLLRKHWAKLLVLLGDLVMLVAMGLTDGRNGMISLGIMAGGMTFLFVYHFITKKYYRFIAAAMAAVVVLVLVYNACTLAQKPFVRDAVHEVNLREGIIALLHGGFETEASADESQQEGEIPDSNSPEKRMPAIPGKAPAGNRNFSKELPIKRVQTIASENISPRKNEQVSHRGLNSGLSLRDEIWLGSWEAIRNNAGNVLFFGRTQFDFREPFLAYTSVYETMDHAHNIYLQVLINWGVPGFLILLAFLAVFAKSAWGLVFAPGYPYWERILFIPAVVILISEMVDCFTLFASDNLALYVLFLFLGLTNAERRQNT